MRFFFYGTLMDGDVRALVLGGAIPADAIGPATILGFRRVYVADRSYPMLTPERRGRVAGLLAHGLDGAAKARIGQFEGDEYRFEARAVHLAGGASTDALVAMARKGVAPGPRSWELVPWQRRHKRVFLSQTRMDIRGRVTSFEGENG